jgi:hypothetical protein
VETLVVGGHAISMHQGEIGLYIKGPDVAANSQQRLIQGWPSLEE